MTHHHNLTHHVGEEVPLSCSLVKHLHSLQGSVPIPSSQNHHGRHLSHPWSSRWWRMILRLRRRIQIDLLLWGIRLWVRWWRLPSSSSWIWWRGIHCQWILTQSNVVTLTNNLKQMLWQILETVCSSNIVCCCFYTVVCTQFVSNDNNDFLNNFTMITKPLNSTKI